MKPHLNCMNITKTNVFYAVGRWKMLVSGLMVFHRAVSKTKLFGLFGKSPPGALPNRS